MKIGQVRNNERNVLQKIVGYKQAPNIMIYDTVYYTRELNESYVTTGVDGEHHTLKALICKEDREGLVKWYKLYVDYHANNYTLEETEAPKE